MSTELRVGKNQSFFRAVNERVEAVSDGAPVDVLYWVCECEDLGCTERIAMTLAEYKALREHPRRFAVVHGHVLPEAERVVEETEGFVVVEKHGVAGEIAEGLNPRT
jgi:hypothetical protein